MTEDGDALIFFIKAKVMDAAARAGFGNFFGRGDELVAAGAAPEVGKGAIGGVEDAFALDGDFLAEEKDLKEFVADFNGSIERGASELIQLRVRMVVGGTVAECFGEVEGFFHGEVSIFKLVGVDGDSEEGSHEGALGLNGDEFSFFDWSGWRFLFLLTRGEKNE